MEQFVRLHWLRADGQDLGSLVRVADLDEAVQTVVEEQMKSTTGVLEVKLPFLSTRDLRRKTEVLKCVTFHREGRWLMPELPLHLQIRTYAADLVWTHPSWIRAGRIKQPFYFRTWRGVSTALQRAMREWIPALFFSDLRSFETLHLAYAMLVYQVSRPFQGTGGYDFTIDLRDYPARMDSLELSWRLTGSSLRSKLVEAERRLKEAGRDDLAPHYSPRLYEDVLRDVRRNPKYFIRLVRKEGEFINNMIDLAYLRTPTAICGFSRAVNLYLRSVSGQDMRHLAIPALREATRVLERLDRLAGIAA